MNGDREYPLFDDRQGCPTARYVGGTSKYLCECDPPCEAALRAEYLWCTGLAVRATELAQQTSDPDALATTTAYVLELTRRAEAAADALRRITRARLLEKLSREDGRSAK